MQRVAVCAEEYGTQICINQIANVLFTSRHEPVTM